MRLLVLLFIAQFSWSQSDSLSKVNLDTIDSSNFHYGLFDPPITIKQQVCHDILVMRLYSDSSRIIQRYFDSCDNSSRKRDIYYTNGAVSSVYLIDEDNYDTLAHQFYVYNGKDFNEYNVQNEDTSLVFSRKHTLFRQVDYDRVIDTKHVYFRLRPWRYYEIFCQNGKLMKKEIYRRKDGIFELKKTNTY